MFLFCLELIPIKIGFLNLPYNSVKNPVLYMQIDQLVSDKGHHYKAFGPTQSVINIPN